MIQLKVITAAGGDECLLTVHKILKVDGKPFVGFADPNTPSPVADPKLADRVAILEQLYLAFFNEWRQFIESMEPVTETTPPIPQKSEET